MYLGHIRDDLSDDDDAQLRCSKLYAEANMLAGTFCVCADDVTTALFRAYCTPRYTASPLVVQAERGNNETDSGG